CRGGHSGLCHHATPSGTIRGWRLKRAVRLNCTIVTGETSGAMLCKDCLSYRFGRHSELWLFAQSRLRFADVQQRSDHSLPCGARNLLLSWRGGTFPPTVSPVSRASPWTFIDSAKPAGRRGRVSSAPCGSLGPRVTPGTWLDLGRHLAGNPKARRHV